MDYLQQDHEFMNRAIALSEYGMSHRQGGPFGAVIVREGQIIGEGYNQVTSGNDPTAHAEIVAIRNACMQIGSFDLSGATLYTSCEPCPMCLGAIYWARIEKILFANTRQDAAAIGFDDAFIYEQIPLPLAQRSLPIHHLPHPKALAIFRQWTELPGKTNY